jgi:hypothetical protein
MRGMSRLDEVLGKLAAELEEMEAPASVEGAVSAEFDRVRRSRRVRVWVSSAAAAAACVAGLWMGVSRPAVKPLEPAAPTEAEAERPFVPIPYVLPPAPDERVEVVRMRVPVAALIAAGLPLEIADPGAQVEADVLVGQDGRPRAVRLVSITSFN